MRTVVVYDSTYGNSEMIARIVAGVLGAHMSSQVMLVAEANTLTLQAGDLLVVGCPTQGHTATPAIRMWFKRFTHNSLKGVYAVAFDTRFRKATWLTGVAARRIAREVRRAGARLLLPTESFFVSATKGPLEQGELDRVTRWAEALVLEIQQHQETNIPVIV